MQTQSLPLFYYLNRFLPQYWLIQKMPLLIFYLFICFPQEDNEIPSTVFVKDSLKTPQPSQYDAESTLAPPSVTGSVDGIPRQEEGLQSISLSSDEESLPVHLEGDEIQMGEEAMGGGSSRTYERRADKFKRNSLKKVDSLKKAFSRTSIEKKVNQITTRIVPPEKREKIMKSLTPNHPKSPTAKSSSFKVTPMTFNIKKVRDGETPEQDASSPGEEAHIDIPPIENLEGEIPLAEVHTDEGFFKQVQEIVSPSTPESMKAELEINGAPPTIECEPNAHYAGLAVPENMEDVGVEGEEEEEQEQEKSKSPVEATADAQIPTATVDVELVSS